MKVHIAGIYTFLLFFCIGGLRANDFYELRQVYKGEVSQINTEDAHVWIKSNQFSKIAEGGLLYVHDGLAGAKAIIRVIKKFPHHIEAELLDGKITDIALQDTVNNIYQWDAHEYLVELTYEHESHKVTIPGKLIIDTRVEVSALFGKRKERILSSLIKEIKFETSDGISQAIEIELHNGKGMKIDYILIEALESLKNKHVTLNLPDKKPIILKHQDLSVLKIIKVLRGVKKLRELHYTLSDNASMQSAGAKYDVTFRFFNIALGFRALERMITQEKDSERLRTLISALKNYTPENIAGVSLVGAFNQWNPDKTPMQLTKQGIYEAKLTLSPGRHSYYFIIRYTGATALDLKVLDPYSNTEDDAYEYIDEDEYLRHYLRQEPCSEGEAANPQPQISTSPTDRFHPGTEETTLPDETSLTEQTIPEETPPQEQSIKAQEPVQEASESLEGVDGKFSLLHIPAHKDTVPKDPLPDTQDMQKAVPFSEEALATEAQQLLTSQDATSVTIGDTMYHKVRFQFQQRRFCPLALKYRINYESRQKNPDQAKIQSLYTLLNNFDQAKITKVAVSGDFNNWDLHSHTLKNTSNETWESEYYLSAGEYQYQFVLSLQVPEKPEILLHMKDFYAQEDTQNTNTTSTLRVNPVTSKAGA